MSFFNSGGGKAGGAYSGDYILEMARYGLRKRLEKELEKEVLKITKPMIDEVVQGLIKDVEVGYEQMNKIDRNSVQINVIFKFANVEGVSE